MNIKLFSNEIRIQALQMVAAANASHIGGVLSIADILGVLYGEVLNIDPGDKKFSLRDRFILSKGHCCSGVYAALAIRGFFPVDDLKNYTKNGSILMSHISHKVPGVEFSTGSLGHGLPFAVGKALAAKRSGYPWRTFVLMSDGELNEGSNWEALMFAGHHELDNLVAIIDYNKLQSLGSTEQTMRLEPLASKFLAFGWDVREVDGHDHTQLRECLTALPWTKKNPSILIAHTIKGKGVSFMENKVEWHYKSPDADQLRKAVDEVRNAV